MGRRVRLARQSEGLAIADCAGASGLSVAEWCALEAGNDNAWHELGGEELVRGAELLGVTVDWIIFGNAA
jgi:transcriptional regulator with XRE-family HTH domain